MNTDERKALLLLTRAVRDGEAALAEIKRLKLDEVPAIDAMAARLRELRAVNDRRKELTRELREGLIFAGVDELNKSERDWTFAATVGAQVLALLGR